MNSNSEQTIKNSPQIEQMYLSRNSWLTIILGTLLVFDLLILSTKGINLGGYPLSNILEGFAFLNLIFLVVMLVKTIKYASLLSSSSFIFGYLEDEFLEHINNKGYKYGFFSLLIFSSFIAFGFDAFLSGFEGLTVKIIASSCASVGCFTYGITILYYLKASDDE